MSTQGLFAASSTRVSDRLDEAVSGPFAGKMWTTALDEACEQLPLPLGVSPGPAPDQERGAVAMSPEARPCWAVHGVPTCCDRVAVKVARPASTHATCGPRAVS